MTICPLHGVSYGEAPCDCTDQILTLPPVYGVMDVWHGEPIAEIRSDDGWCGNSLNPPVPKGRSAADLAQFWGWISQRGGSPECAYVVHDGQATAEERAVRIAQARRYTVRTTTQVLPDGQLLEAK
uniref:Uncharacterized protein n=1 Tax=viral metagenome TaxID=1070528 RepID=A0A6H1Z9B8_9ZZZZ